jgi:hypothetical protein
MEVLSEEAVVEWETGSVWEGAQISDEIARSGIDGHVIRALGIDAVIVGLTADGEVTSPAKRSLLAGREGTEEEAAGHPLGLLGEGEVASPDMAQDIGRRHGGTGRRLEANGEAEESRVSRQDEPPGLKGVGSGEEEK